MRMTARQIIQEIATLPAAEQQEVFITLQEHLKVNAASVATPSAPVRYLAPEAAEPLIKEILTDHADLFRKLAQ